ncbi:MAG TPA: hypothetical protein V6C97_06150, partial [Oculatellaceae cyanobacterium]
VWMYVRVVCAMSVKRVCVYVCAVYVAVDGVVVVIIVCLFLLAAGVVVVVVVCLLLMGCCCCVCVRSRIVGRQFTWTFTHKHSAMMNTGIILLHMRQRC